MVKSKNINNKQQEDGKGCNVAESISNGFRIPYTIEMLMDLELTMSIELGRRAVLMRDIAELKPGDIITLDKHIDEPIDLLINNKKFAEGVLIGSGSNIRIRITALVCPSDRFLNLKEKEPALE